MNISDLKRLAGIGTDNNEPSMGENISQTATALKQKERKPEISVFHFKK